MPPPTGFAQTPNERKAQRKSCRNLLCKNQLNSKNLLHLQSRKVGREFVNELPSHRCSEAFARTSICRLTRTTDWGTGSVRLPETWASPVLLRRRFSSYLSSDYWPTKA